MIDSIVSHLGQFDADNRAGLERTLHRISAIRNRRGSIVGLTCPGGPRRLWHHRHHSGSAGIGKIDSTARKTGIGKTTMLRESARILAGTSA